MAFLEVNLFSQRLQMETTIQVLLPEKKHVLEQLHPEKRYPVLYVLHGYGEQYSSWIRKSVLESVVKDLDIIVVMPDARNSFYSNMVSGLEYETFLVEELPIKLANFFPVSLLKEDTFIMGNSMGGYGAFKLAMLHPDKYAAAVSFSGTLGLQLSDSYMLMRDEGVKKSVDLAFGDAQSFEASNQNLYRCVHQLCAYEGKLPRFYHLCGTKDEIAYTMGLEFINYVRSRELIPIQYEEIQEGEHDWKTWNGYIQTALAFLLEQT